jgi:hypothetical protein
VFCVDRRSARSTAGTGDRPPSPSSWWAPDQGISRVSLEIVPVGHPGMTDVRSASPEMRSTPGMAVDGTPNKGRAIRSGTPITIGRAPIVRGRLSVVPEPD